jgi:hypothetical protein
MDVKDKLRVVIEFLLVEGCAGEEMVTRLWNMYSSAA